MVVPIFVDLAFEDACYVPAPSEVVFLAPVLLAGVVLAEVVVDFFTGGIT